MLSLMSDFKPGSASAKPLYLELFSKPTHSWSRSDYDDFVVELFQ